MKTLNCAWQDPRIESFPLSKLTPMDLHNDERWKTRDLPRIKRDGLWYPIMLYKVTLDWWHNKFTKWRPHECHYVDPTVNEDEMIWAIKVGSNRYQVAQHLGYDAISGIMCDHSDDCAKLGIWMRDADPLNTNIPYTGDWSYGVSANINNYRYNSDRR